MDDLHCPHCSAILTLPDPETPVYNDEQVDVECPGCGEEVSLMATVTIKWEVPPEWNRPAATADPGLPSDQAPISGGEPVSPGGGYGGGGGA